jgi:hypothetical protein
VRSLGVTLLILTLTLFSRIAEARMPVRGCDTVTPAPDPFTEWTVLLGIGGGVEKKSESYVVRLGALVDFPIVDRFRLGTFAAVDISSSAIVTEGGVASTLGNFGLRLAGGGEHFDSGWRPEVSATITYGRRAVLGERRSHCGGDGTKPAPQGSAPVLAVNLFVTARIDDAKDGAILFGIELP